MVLSAGLGAEKDQPFGEGAKRASSFMGKRGGLRVVYFWWSAGMQFWLHTLCGRDELTDLTAGQRRVSRDLLKAELDARRSK
ncbi:MAG: hypothetical protein U1F45_13075 [Burkholderiales bacterium]